METNQVTDSTATDRSGKDVNSSSMSVTKPEAKKAVAPRGKSDARLRARAPRSGRRKSAPEKLVLPILW
jgi:hypothetical protein